MGIFTNEPPFPRDKDELLREVNVRMRLADIRRTTETKSRLAPRWWEAGVIVLLFASALGLLASLAQYVEVREEPLDLWMLFWFGLMIMTIVLTFEFLLVKIYALRRANDLLLRMYTDLHERLGELEGDIGPIESQGETPPETDN